MTFKISFNERKDFNVERFKKEGLIKQDDNGVGVISVLIDGFEGCKSIGLKNGLPDMQEISSFMLQVKKLYDLRGK